MEGRTLSMVTSALTAVVNNSISTVTLGNNILTLSYKEQAEVSKNGESLF
jgi:hypothetical protein